MWLGSKYRSFLLGIDLTKLRGCATPVTDSKHPRTPPCHKSTARSRHFEKLFANILPDISQNLFSFPFMQLPLSLYFTFTKLHFSPQTSQIRTFFHKNISITLVPNFYISYNANYFIKPNFPKITLWPQYFFQNSSFHQIFLFSPKI